MKVPEMRNIKTALHQQMIHEILRMYDSESDYVSYRHLMKSVPGYQGAFFFRPMTLQYSTTFSGLDPELHNVSEWYQDGTSVRRKRILILQVASTCD